MIDVVKAVGHCLLSRGCDYCDFENCEEFRMTCRNMMNDCIRLIGNKDFEKGNSNLIEVKKSLNECILGVKKDGTNHCTSCRYFEGNRTLHFVICIPLMEECLKELEQMYDED